MKIRWKSRDGDSCCLLCWWVWRCFRTDMSIRQRWLCAGKPERNSAALGYFITPCVATLGTLLCYLLLPHLVSGPQAVGVWNQQNMSSDSLNVVQLFSHSYVFADEFFCSCKRKFFKIYNYTSFHFVPACCVQLSDCVDSLFQEFARFYLKRSQFDALETSHKLLDSTGWSTDSLTQPVSLSSKTSRLRLLQCHDVCIISPLVARLTWASHEKLLFLNTESWYFFTHKSTHL